MDAILIPFPPFPPLFVQTHCNGLIIDGVSSRAGRARDTFSLILDLEWKNRNGGIMFPFAFISYKVQKQGYITVSRPYWNWLWAKHDQNIGWVNRAKPLIMESDNIIELWSLSLPTVPSTNTSKYKGKAWPKQPEQAKTNPPLGVT